MKKLFLVFIPAALLLLVLSLFLPNLINKPIQINKDPHSNQTKEIVRIPLPNRTLGITGIKENKIYGWIPHFDFQNGLNSALYSKNKLTEVHITGASINENGEIVYNSAFESNLQKVNSNSINFGINIISVNPDATSKFLNSNQEKFTNQIRSFKKFAYFKSVNLNIENMNSSDSSKFIEFIKKFRMFLNTQNLKLLISIYPKSNNSNSSYTADAFSDYRTILENTDYLILMFYDSYRFTKTAGNSPLDWLENGLNLLPQDSTSLDKVIIGVPLFGYGFNGNLLQSSFTYSQLKGFANNAVLNAKSEKNYKSENTTIYFQDSETLKIRKTLANSKGINKFIYWRLGGESGIDF